MKDKIIKYIDSNKNWLFETIMSIVSKNTINRIPNGNENNGQDLLENLFNDMGLKIDRFSPDEVRGLKSHEAYLEGRDYSNRDNLVGYIGNGMKKTIIFSGHMDTVPTEHLSWEVTSAFYPKKIGNRIYGIGSLDMKGGLVSSIFALKVILDMGIDIKGKVILESVVDEEFGGANGTLACILKGYEGDFAIIPEPTNMKVCPVLISQKIYRIHVRGKQGINLGKEERPTENPIFVAARLIKALLDYENYLNSLKNNFKLLKDYDKPMTFISRGIKAGEIGEDKLFTTPSSCEFDIAIKNYYGIDEKEFDRQLFDFLNKYKVIRDGIKTRNIVFKKCYRYLPGSNYNFSTRENKYFINKLIENGKWCCNREMTEIGADFAGDLFMFNDYSKTPAICLGPGGANGHAADEYVDLNDLIDLSKIFALLIYDLCC